MRSAFLLLAAAVACSSGSSSGGPANIRPEATDQVVLHISPKLCTSNCTEVFTQTINQCKSASAPCTVAIEAGTYNIHGGRGPRISLTGLSHVSIVGVAGQTVLMVDGIGCAFQINNCTDLTISGLTLDQPRVPFTLGKVTNVGKGTATMSVNGTLYPATGDSWLNQAQATMEFDVQNDRPAVNALDSYTAAPLSWNGNQVTISAPFAGQMRVGASYILRHQVYAFNAIGFNDLVRPTFSDLDILSTPGMGIVGSTARDATFSNIRVRRTKGRHMSITADGLHIMNAQGFVLVENCLFEGQGDDGINIPTVYNSVIQRLSANSVSMGGRLNNTAVVNPSMGIGDTVKFRSRRTLVGYFTTRVTAIDPRTLAVTFADPLPRNFALFDLVVSETQKPDWILIRNNTFTNNRARGLLLKQQNTLVADNHFIGCSGPAIQADPDGCYWFEGDAVSNWTFQGNEVSQNNYGPAKQSGDVWLDSCVPNWDPDDGTPLFQGHSPEDQQPHSSVSVLNNYFYQFSGQAAISVKGVAGVHIHSNTIEWDPHSAPPHSNFMTPDSTDLDITLNTCRMQGASAIDCK